MIRVLFINAIILLPTPPQRRKKPTQAASLLQYLHLGTHFPFILYRNCSLVTMRQLLFGDASATAVLQFLPAILSDLSASEAAIISVHLGSFSWSTIFHLPLLVESDRRIAAVVSAAEVFFQSFGSQRYREGRANIGQQGEGSACF